MKPYKKASESVLFYGGVTTRCGTRNLFRFASSAANFDRCRIRPLASSAPGGASGRIRLEPPLRCRFRKTDDASKRKNSLSAVFPFVYVRRKSTTGICWCRIFTSYIASTVSNIHLIPIGIVP